MGDLRGAGVGDLPVAGRGKRAPKEPVVVAKDVPVEDPPGYDSSVESGLPLGEGDQS